MESVASPPHVEQAVTVGRSPVLDCQTQTSKTHSMSSHTYAQPFATPQRSSYIGASLNALPKIQTSEPALTQWGGGPIVWLLGSDRDEWILAATQEGKTLLDDNLLTKYDGRLAKHGVPIFGPSGLVLTRNPSVSYDPNLGDRRSIRGIHHRFDRRRSPLRGIFWERARRVGVGYKAGHPHNSGGGGAVVWGAGTVHLPETTRPFQGPVLADATAIVCFKDRFVPVRYTGEILPAVGVQFLPNLVAAHGDTVWGFVKGGTGYQLLGIAIDGDVVQRGPTVAPPVQPPIIHEDGTIDTLSELPRDGMLTRTKGGKVAWTAALGEHHVESGPRLPPMATAVADGEVLVRIGSTLVLVGADGKIAWEVETPRGAAITSNPLVQTDGRVLFAAGNRVHLLAGCPDRNTQQRP